MDRRIKPILVVGGLLLVHLILREQRKKVPTIHYLNRVPLNFNAMTIPPIGIFIDKKQQANMELLRHELIHWRQYQKMGLGMYYYNYVREYLLNGYDLSSMEQEARAGEDHFCKTNYTSCVRTGKAKTVFNPLFRKI